MKRMLFALAILVLAGTHVGASYVGAKAGRYLQASRDQKLAVAHSCGAYDTQAAFRWIKPDQVQILETSLNVAALIPQQKPGS